MLAKTEGIVLQTIKHSDSGIISHILTREYGMLSFIIKGVHNKKGGHKVAYFQPLHILNLEIYYRAKRNLQSVKEVSIAYPLMNIPMDFARNSIAFFVGEVFRKTLNEAESNSALYNFARESIIFLDSENNIVNFHIGFLVRLAMHLGIAPSMQFSLEKPFFDIQNGIYTDSPPLHGYYFDREYSELLSKFLNSTVEDCNEIPLSGAIRSSFLDNLLTYFAMHLPGLNKIKSLEVLSEVFK